MIALLERASQAPYAAYSYAYPHKTAYRPLDPAMPLLTPELAAVIGKKCRNVSIEDADSVIFGYTCLNDVSARDLQKVDGQWARAKGYDTFSPIGP